jgi:DNA invertase Pin-like site-specific DNA recombinase
MQKEKIQAYCNLYNYTLATIFIDAGESAATLKRPELQHALSYLQKHPNVGLVVYKLDRLTRSILDLGTLLNKYFTKHPLMSITESLDTSSATGRMVINIMASVSQWERECIAERTQVAMDHKKMRGEWCGGKPPFGYTVVGGKLIKDEREQEIISIVRKLKLTGMSYQKITRELISLGYLPRSGISWQVATIVDICLQEKK